MTSVGIYLEGRRLTLFKDENINVTSKATDINNIGKVFMDYSQSFTVPANDNNNAIFQHFYDVDLFGTFNSNIRVDCYIELDTIPFKYGKMQLEGIKLKNKQPDNYKVTFYGNLKQLDDKFKDDELSVLNLSGYTHNYNLSNIKLGVQTSDLNDGDTIYPLIGNSVWQYGTADSNDITYSIDFKELKPAIRVKNLLEAVEEKYGITFQSKFFDRAPFQNLFLWASKGKENMVCNSIEQTPDFVGQGSMGTVDATVDTVNNTLSFTQEIFNGLGGHWGRYSLRAIVYPVPGFNFEVPFKIRIYVNGIKTVESDFVSGIQYIEYATPINPFTNVNYNIEITVESAYEFNYACQITLYRTVWINPIANFIENGDVLSDVGVIEAFVDIAKQLPSIKIKDFIGGIIKMFNLVIRPLSPTEFYLEPLDDFQDAGEIFDITNYIDVENISVDRPKIFSEIAFKYQKAETILNRRYRKLFDAKDEFGYGDLRATYEIDNKAELKIELPFELMMLERLKVRYPHPSATTGGTTNIHIGTAMDEKYEAVNTKPILFFHNGIEFYNEFPFKLTGDSITYGNIIGNHNDKFSTQITDSLTWGSGVNTYTYEDNPESLYSNYWARYIESIYDLKQRRFSYNAILPPSIINSLNINDKLVIGDQRYKIEDYTLNLTNGETEFNLSNDIRTFQYGDSISKYFINATPSKLYYSFQVITKDDWTVSKVDLGDDVDWATFTTETGGTGNGWVTLLVDKQPSLSSQARQMNIITTINGSDYTLNLVQEGYI